MKEHSLLITEDKDFGEITYRLKYAHKGILLIRLNDIPRKERIEQSVEVITKYILTLQNSFSVLDKRGLRVKATS